MANIDAEVAKSHLTTNQHQQDLLTSGPDSNNNNDNNEPDEKQLSQKLSQCQLIDVSGGAGGDAALASVASESSFATQTPPPTPIPISPNPEMNSEPAEPAEPEPIYSFEENFKSFAKFGDCKSSGETITLTNIDKWFKQAKIIDPASRAPVKITTTDTGIYFKQVAKTKKSLTLAEFKKFLETLAKSKKMEIETLKEKLKKSGPPATNKTTTAVISGAIGRLTDVSKYTGSHRQRFDGKTGKGLGKAGREDLVKNTGYVTGFKA